MSGGRVFISYRRGDADSAAAARLNDRLEMELEPDSIFFDIDAIPLGVDFTKYLDEKVAECDAFVVVLGRDWLDAADRLHKADDFVRIEIEAALKRPHIPIIPVLVGDIEMPALEALPEPLHPLLKRNGISLPHAHFVSGVTGRIVPALKAAMQAALDREEEAREVERLATENAALQKTVQATELRAHEAEAKAEELGRLPPAAEKVVDFERAANSTKRSHILLRMAAFASLPLAAVLAYFLATTSSAPSGPELEAASEQIRTLNVQLNEANAKAATASDLQKRFEDAIANAADMEARLNRALADADNSAEEIETLTDRVDSAKAEAAKLLGQVKDAQQNLTSAREKEQELIKFVANLEARANSAEAATAKARLEASDLSARLALAEDASANTIELREEIERLKVQLAQTDSLRERLAKADADLASAQVAFTDQQQAMREALAKQAAAEADREVAAEERDAIAAKLQSEQARLSTAQSKLADEEKLAAEQTKRVQLLNTQTLALREQLATLTTLLDEAEEKDQEREVQIADLGSRLNVALARMAQQGAAQQEKVKEMEAEIARLKLELETASNEAAAVPLSRRETEEAQELLNALGFEVGRPDGVAGRRTMSSADRFRAKAGLPSADTLDSALLDTLRLAATFAAPDAVSRTPGSTGATGSGAGLQRKDCAGCPEMINLPGGTFTMGSPEGEEGRDADEGPQREVVIASFALAATEVTFDQWAACAADGGCQANPSPDDEGWGKGDRPVINISWEDAQEYVDWLNTKVVQGASYRLPSEAEWEYAARAKTTTPFSFGDTISTSQANYDGTATYGSGVTGAYRRRTVPVNDLDSSNAWGLRHMHGNVWEWVEDCWSNSYEAAVPDATPFVSQQGADCSRRVVRGGSWDGYPQDLRSADRGRVGPDYRNYDLGFRPARTPFTP